MRETLVRVVRSGRARVAAVALPLTVAAGSAFADVPTDVTDALSSMKSDALVVATAFIVAVIAVSAFLMMRKGAKS